MVLILIPNTISVISISDKTSDKVCFHGMSFVKIILKYVIFCLINVLGKYHSANIYLLILSVTHLLLLRVFSSETNQMVHKDCRGSDFVLYGLDYALPSLYSLAVCTMIPPIYIYISAYIKNELKSTKLLFYSGLFMFIFIPLSLIFNAIYSLYRCHDPEFGELIASARFYIYPIQGIMLTLILFIRLISIFQETKFRLSKCTIISYITLVILGFLFTVIGNSLIQWNKTHFIGLLIWILAGFDYLFIVIWLNVLFLTKIFKVHTASRMNLNNRKKLLNMITKTTILCIMSTSFLLIYLVVFFVYVGTSGSLKYYVIIAFILCADLYSNFLSILLSYSYFAAWYKKLCGCCHYKCIQCWGKCSKGDGVELSIHPNTPVQTKSNENTETTIDTNIESHTVSSTLPS